VDWSDIRLGLGAPALYTESFTGIVVSPRIGASIPISLRSRQAGTITNLSAGVGLSRQFGMIGLEYSFGAGRGIHAQPGSYISSANADTRDAQGNLVYVCRTDADYCGVGGNNTAWSLSNGLSVNVTPLEKLSFAAGLTVVNAYKYPVAYEVDEFTPKAVDSNGNPVARPGAGRSDKLTASIGASYSLTDQLAVSFGIGTEGPPRTDDNKAFRFPFFSFIGGENNYTAYSLTLSAAL
jgi:hypothetical protein